MGMAKRWLNWFSEPRSPGLMNWKRFQSSVRWFSMGVPVVTILNFPCKSMAARERLVMKFLMAWASSRIMVSQFRVARSADSCWSRP